MVIGDVRPFRYTYSDDKRQFLKPLEEAAEVFGAWQYWVNHRHSTKLGQNARDKLLDEVADCIQACVNCADALGVEDMGKYMEACERRNKQRGRY